MPNDEVPHTATTNNNDHSSNTSYAAPSGLPPTQQHPPTQHQAPIQQAPPTQYSAPPTQQLPQTQQHPNHPSALSRDHHGSAIPERNTNRQSLPNDANISSPRSSSRPGFRTDEPVSANSATAPNFSYPTSRSQQAPPTMAHPTGDSTPHLYGSSSGAVPASRTEPTTHSYGASSAAVPASRTEAAPPVYNSPAETEVQHQQVEKNRSTLGNLKKAALGIHVRHNVVLSFYRQLTFSY